MDLNSHKNILPRSKKIESRMLSFKKENPLKNNEDKN